MHQNQRVILEKRKEEQQRFCENHPDIFNTLYFIGRGVMFRYHLVELAMYFGYSQRGIDRALREGTDCGLFLKHQFGQRVYYSLRKPALAIIRKKESHQISSIEVTGATIMKTAFRTERILRLLKNGDTESWPEVGKSETKWKTFVRQVRHFSTISYHQNELWRFWNWLAKETKEIEPFVTNLNRQAIHTEIELLKKNQNQPTTTLKNLKAQGIEIHRFISLDSTMDLQVDLLDLNGLLTPEKIIRKLSMAIEYLILFYHEFPDINVKVLVSNSTRKDFLNTSKTMMEEEVRKRTKLIQIIPIEILDLQLTTKLFGNRPWIL